jgi:hypothetical protein
MPESEQLAKMQRSLERIEHCVIGDPAAGQVGLVARTNDHSARIKRLERFGAYAIGAWFLLVAGYRVLIDWVARR